MKLYGRVYPWIKISRLFEKSKTGNQHSIDAQPHGEKVYFQYWYMN